MKSRIDTRVRSFGVLVGHDFLNGNVIDTMSGILCGHFDSDR